MDCSVLHFISPDQFDPNLLCLPCGNSDREMLELSCLVASPTWAKEVDHTPKTSRYLS